MTLQPTFLKALLAIALLTVPAAAQYRITVGNPVEARGGVETVFGRSRIYVRLGKKTLTFEADPADVTELPEGWKVSGGLGIRTSGGLIEMSAAEVLFERAANGGIERMRGHAFLPPPYVSQRIEIASPAMAEMGVDLGKNIDLGVPLNPETPYVFFRFEAGLSMSMGLSDEPGATKPLTLTVPGGIDGVYILDPSDPFYYVSGAFLEKEGDDDESDDRKKSADDPTSGSKGDSTEPSDSDGSKREGDGGSRGEEEPQDSSTGMGRSKNGRIPFVPRDVRGLEEFVKPFQGTHLDKGVIPIANLPLELRGTMVTRFEKLDDSGEAFDPLGIGFGPTYHAGGNGDLAVTFSFGSVAGSSLFEFGFDLGHGTVGIDVDRDDQQAWLRGVIDPDTSWIPAVVPLRPDGRIELVGYLSTEVHRSFFDARGSYALSLSDFGGWMARKIGGDQKIDGHLHADENGLYLRGTSRARFDLLKLDSTAEVEARLASGADYVRFGGSFGVAGARIQGDLTFAEESGLRGRLKTRELDLGIDGRFQMGTTLRYVGELEVDPRFEQKLHGALVDVAAEVEREVAAGLAELEEATKDYEFELSLRGIRPAIPRLCQVAIDEIRSEVPRRINARWPKKFGVEVPGRKTALKKAKKSYQPYIDRLAHLSRVAKKGDDAVLRGEIERAIRDVLKHDTLKVKVKVLGTVYEKPILSRSQKSQLKEGLTAIRSLPAKSDRKVSAKKAFDAIRKSDALRDLGARIQSGVTQGLPRIEAITFDMPALPVGAGQFSVRLRLRTADQVSEPTFRFDCDDPFAFVSELARSWRYR